MDTEGFGGVGEGQNHDTRIFLFALLLSSLFLYNSVGAIDENALQTISLVTNLAREIHKTEERELDEDEIAETFPFFLWIVRDFALQLVDSQNRDLSAGEYLENALSQLRGNSDSIENKNKIRRQFKHFFRSRDCITLVRPVEREADLQRLEELSPLELRPEFIRQIEKAKKLIFARAKRKMMKGTPVDGPKLLALAKAYAEAINAGKAPNLESAWTYLTIRENEKLSDMLLEKYSQKVSGMKDESSSIVQEAIQEFNKNRFGSTQDAQKTLEKFLINLEERVKALTAKKAKEMKENAKKEAKKIIDGIRAKIIAGAIEISRLDQICEDELQGLKKRLGWSSDEEPSARAVFKIFAQKKGELSTLALSFNEGTLNKKISELETSLHHSTVKEKTFEKEILLLKEQIQVEQLERKRAERLAAEKSALNEELKERVNKLESKLDMKEGEILAAVNHHEEKRASIISTLQEENKILKIQMSNQLGESKKEIALLQQKEHQLQNEVRRMKEAILEKERDLELAKSESKKPDENQRFVEAILEERTKDFEELKESYEKVIQALSGEKSMLQQQLKTLIETVESQKAQSIGLLDDIRAKINGLDAQKKYSEDKSSKVKEKYSDYKKIVTHTTVSQCVKCNQFISTALFKSHLDLCLDEKPNQNQAENSRNFITVSVKIGQTLVREEQRPDGKKTCTEYIMHVERADKSWYVSRKFKEFCELLGDLEAAIPGLILPPSCQELWGFLNDIWSLLGGKSIPIEERRKLLQNMMRDLCKLEVVVTSQVFRRFLGESAKMVENPDEFTPSKKIKSAY